MKNKVLIGDMFFRFGVLLLGGVLAACHMPENRQVAAAEDPGVRHYSVYRPEITDHVMIGFNQNGLKYRHVAAIERFKGRFYAVCNANTVTGEAQPGQRCVLVESQDGQTWSDPVNVTPSTSGEGKYKDANVQWQGGLFNWNDQELWFFWCEEPNAILHLSVLKDPGGEWLDRVIQTGYLHDGVEFAPFACNNPIQLSNGRIMLPIIVQDISAYHSGEKPLSWKQIRKYSVALVSDDDGTTWQVEKGTLIADPPADPNGGPFVGVWEPMYVLQADGRVRTFSRTSGNRLLTAVGDAEGKTMGPWSVSSIRTLQSRHWVGQAGARRIMVHHDDYRKEVNWRDRHNLALFFSRSGADDFAAGNSVVGRDVQVQYPQSLVFDDKLYVAYTYEAGYQLRCAIVDPLPAEDEYYIFPRGDRRGIFAEELAYPQTNVEYIDAGNGREWVRMCGNAAAGVDMDAVDPQTDTLTMSFPLFLENWEWRKMIRFASVGDGQVMLGWSSEKPDALQVCIDGKWQVAGPFSAETWKTVSLSINRERIQVGVDGEVQTFPPASGFSGRVYLGDGYPSEKLYVQCRYLVDVSELQTRVKKPVK